MSLCQCAGTVTTVYQIWKLFIPRTLFCLQGIRWWKQESRALPPLSGWDSDAARFATQSKCPQAVGHLPVPSLFIICREVIPLQNSNNSLALIRFPRVHGCTNVCFNCQWLTWDLYALCQWMTRAFPFMLLNTFLTLFACKWLCHPEL